MTFPNSNNTTATFLTNAYKTSKTFSILSLLLTFCLIQTSLYAAETSRVSVTSGNIQGNNSSYFPSISANGRFVAFWSFASNLVAGDTNGFEDIFVHDRLSGQTARVSVDSSGIQANSRSYRPSVSADGRFVTFWSSASNLVAGDTNSQSDIFVHDRLNHKTIRASVDSSGVQGLRGSDNPSINADGRFISFTSLSSNLVPDDTNVNYDIFVHDHLTGHTSRVSVATGGDQANNSSDSSSLNADGRFVAFGSSASNLVNGDTNIAADIFVRDRLTGQTSRVSVATDGSQANSSSGTPSISADGRFVAFESFASNLVSNDTNNLRDIFVHDRQTGQTKRVSISSSGSEGNDLSMYPKISADGRFIAFHSTATNLVSSDTNTDQDAFVHDRLSGQTTRASVSSSSSQANNWSYNPTLSADGRFLTFFSAASNLVSVDTNGNNDIFVRDRLENRSIKADLKISMTQKPVSLTKNSQGTFGYTINNNGPATVTSVRIQHLFANGQIIALTPAKGSCRRYTSISLCDLGSLAAGGNTKLTVVLKALRNPLTQNLSLSSNGPADPVPANNYLNISTTVTP